MSTAYTTEMPTEPGWYWCRNKDSDSPTGQWEAVVRVDLNERGVPFCTWLTEPGDADLLFIDDWSPDAQWHGPLQPPA